MKKECFRAQKASERSRMAKGERPPYCTAQSVLGSSATVTQVALGVTPVPYEHSFHSLAVEYST